MLIQWEYKERRPDICEEIVKYIDPSATDYPFVSECTAIELIVSTLFLFRLLLVEFSYSVKV